MKSIYKKEIIKEKLNKSPRKHLIQKLQQWIDKDTPFSKSIYYESSMLVSATDFREYNKSPISNDAQVVMSYIGDNFIQSLNTGEWVVTIDGKEIKNKDIKILEEKLWESIKDKYKSI